MKKVFVLFISLLFTVSLLSVTSFAAEKTKLSAASAEAAPESEVSVPIELSDNKGLWGLMFNVYFDTDVFEVKEIVNNKEVFKSSDITIGPSDFGKGYVRVVVTPTSISNNNTSNGAICILKLNVDKNAKAKDYLFQIVLDEACDIDGNDVEVSTVYGKVTVKDIGNIAQTNSQKRSLKSNDKDSANSDDSDVEVLAKAEDNKLIEVEHTEDLDFLGNDSDDKDFEKSSNKSNNNKDNSENADDDTDKNDNNSQDGNSKLNENGEDLSENEISAAGENDNNSISDGDSENKSEATGSNSISVLTICIIIAVAVAFAVAFAAALAVVIVLLVKRRKKK